MLPYILQCGVDMGDHLPFCGRKPVRRDTVVRDAWPVPVRHQIADIMSPGRNPAPGQNAVHDVRPVRLPSQVALVLVAPHGGMGRLS